MCRICIKTELTEMLIEDLAIREEKIKEEAKMIDNLGLDSIDIIEFILLCEKQYEISIPDIDVEKVVTFEDVINYLYKRVWEGKAKCN